MKKFLRRIASIAGFMASALCGIWLLGIICFCGPFGSKGNILLAILWVAAFCFVYLRMREHKWKRYFVAGLIFIVLIPYLSMRPSHDRAWEEPQARTSSATISSDTLAIHNFRSFDYDAKGVPIGKWESRVYDLKKIRGMDFFMTHWTSYLAGHPIFSFDFGDEGHLAFTIEARTEKGEIYSLPAGLFRRFELSYIPCEESDAVRVRSNFRKNEHVYIYHTIATPVQARARLLEFVATMNDIAEKPRFYNVVTSNCTTAVRSQMTGGFPFDWRIILNGRLDEMLYERGLLVTTGLSFPELKRQAYINPKVREHPEKEGFSARIRKEVPGF